MSPTINNSDFPACRSFTNGAFKLQKNGDFIAYKSPRNNQLPVKEHLDSRLIKSKSKRVPNTSIAEEQFVAIGPLIRKHSHSLNLRKKRQLTTPPIPLKLEAVFCRFPQAQNQKRRKRSLHASRTSPSCSSQDSGRSPLKDSRGRRRIQCSIPTTRPRSHPKKRGKTNPRRKQ